MWIAIKDTAMEAKADRCLVEVEKWESDSKGATPLTLLEVRYSQLKAISFIKQADSIMADSVMGGPDVYQVRRGEETVANIWQPLNLGAKLEITFPGSQNAPAPVLFGDLTVECVLKLLNEKLHGTWKRPAAPTFELDMVLQ
jgi:hypothetical protein